MRHPMNFVGTYPTNWAGYVYKDRLGYTSGLHTGVDYNHGTDDLGDPAYAITDGTVVGVVKAGQIGGFGNAIIIRSICPPGVSGTKMYHRYLHLNRVDVTLGQAVAEGQQIGTVGMTGTTAAHLHLDLWTDRNGLGGHWGYHKDTQLSSYEDPFRVIENNKSWRAKGGDMANRTQVNNIYKAVLHRNGDEGGLTNYTGRDANQIITEFMGSQEFKNHVAFITNATKQITSLQTALKNEQNKPPVEVIKEVDKIVEKIVKVEVPVEIIKTVEVEPSWLVRVRDFINQFLNRK